MHFKGQVHVFGIRFKPEGLLPALGMTAAEARSGFMDMESFAGHGFRELCSRLRTAALSEAFLRKKLEKNNAGLYYLNWAAEMIRRKKGLISMDELAASAYISPRQLEREFKQKIGLTPKRYMRLARLNEVNRLLEKHKQLGLTTIAYESGYADQAHFIRDFKHFTGKKPTVFIREREQFIVNTNMGG